MKIQLTLAASCLLLASAAAADAKPPGKPHQLPPGLQKKVQRGGELPPGWQKKLQRGHILDDEIFRHGTVISPRDADGLITLRIDNEIVRLVSATHEIVDILTK